MRAARPAARAVLATLGLGLAGTLAAPAAAGALDVEPATAGKLAYQRLTFVVRNDRRDADLTGVTIVLPPDAPVPYAAPRVDDGWVARSTSRAVTTPVTIDGWNTATVPETVSFTGGPIPPGGSHAFEVEVGPFPLDRDVFRLVVLQDYSDGRTEVWDQVPRRPAERVERPAPRVVLLDNPAATLYAQTSGLTVRFDGPTVADLARPPVPAAPGPAVAGRLGWLPFGLAAVALGLGLAALLRRRPRPA